MLHTRRRIFVVLVLSFAITAAWSFSGSDVALALDLNISITIPGSSTPAEEGGGGSGEGVVIPTATVSFSGLAYPGANITYLRDGVVIGTGNARLDGTFLREFVASPGVATFGVWARDRFGLLSPTISVSLDVVADSVVNIESLAVPPTIAHEQLKVDGSLELYGSAFPGSVLRVFNNITPFTTPFTVAVPADGVWRYAIARGGFNVSNFSYKANYQYERLSILSPFSNLLELRLVTCMNSDFNHDGAINLTDLSILLFYWGRAFPTNGLTNACVDRNQDQVIDLRDFSILMYEWTAKYQLSNEAR